MTKRHNRDKFVADLNDLLEQLKKERALRHKGVPGSGSRKELDLLSEYFEGIHEAVASGVLPPRAERERMSHSRLITDSPNWGYSDKLALLALKVDFTYMRL